MFTEGSARAAAIIPALDAEKTIASVVEDTVRAFCDIGEVIVVDDGSTDRTAEIAEKAGAIVVSHPFRKGKGQALRTGLGAASDRGFRAAVTLDADGQHPPEEAARLARHPAPTGSLILGIRDLAGANAPRANRISNGISNGFLSLFSRTLLADTQCGLRRYPLPTALSLGGNDDGYAFEAEIILLAISARVPVVEVPIQVVYPEDRTTHFDSVRDPMRVVARVVRTLARTRGITRRARA